MKNGYGESQGGKWKPETLKPWLPNSEKRQHG